MWWFYRDYWIVSPGTSHTTLGHSPYISASHERVVRVCQHPGHHLVQLLGAELVLLLEGLQPRHHLRREQRGHTGHLSTLGGQGSHN